MSAAETSSKQGRSAAEIIQQINAKNAKIFALILVLGFIMYHGMLHFRYGIDSCTWLLSDGEYKGSQEWQPYGCMMHHYSQTDTRQCLRYLAFWGTHNHFVFIGDSRIRQLYLAFLSHLDPSHGNVARIPHLASSPVLPLSSSSSKAEYLSTQLQNAQVHTDLTFQDSKLRLRVDFVWSPLVSKHMIEAFQHWKKENEPPSVIIAGSATWAIKESNASAKALKEYTYNLTRLVQSIDKITEKRKDGGHSHVLWTLQEPVDVDRLRPTRAMITNEQIDLYNKAAMEILQHSGAQLWSSSRLIAQGNLEESDDGLHIGPLALKHDTQILLNMYCNDHMNFNDGTCCSSPEHYTTLQVVTFSSLGVCALIAGVMLTRKTLRRVKVYGKGVKMVEESEIYVLMTGLAKLGFIMAYFFLCDRTNFFMKENKYFSQVGFWLPIGYVFALGLFFTEDSRSTKVLHRDQTDEWKGWMQLVILIYHMTGASRVLPIYMHIRVLVSAYLFLTGYGHFCYFWHTGDAGLIRFLQVLFRTNFMTVALCLCMNRPYQFYYFVPLVSFWFVMTYLVLALPPHVTMASSETNPLQYLYLVLKFVGLFSVITILYMSEVFFEKVFVTRPWKALFVTTDDDIHEWWFRWKLDRYSSMYGMIFAFAFVLLRRHSGFLDDNNHGNLFSRGASLSAVLTSLLAIGGYTGFSFLCRNKLECNEVHSYVVFVPILGYIVLRNVSGALRTRHSAFFAWFGRISLELLVGQVHAWLAADAHGILVLVPGWPVLNALITSYIFACAAHELHSITAALLPLAVPTSDWRKGLRNLILFFAILLPIGVHDGMF
ncbi:N-acetylneuraminate 9-O-acetyltransferase [Ischnura elegans]|uniref:N-acetylneuraminate 9-O-acetyltransferase n=1 Tax=Ischnura elegans TaxID=197161 RepID=UPI001ED87010|nr:N-acetylneuraminate 9-O-acetyltransferase [Ischnura elegans]